MSSVCKLLVLLAVFSLSGCSGLTIGPVVERKVIIVKPGTGIEVLDQVKVHGHVLGDGSGSDGSDVFEVDIGGWIAIDPDHWKAIKSEVQRLKAKAGEK